MFEKELEAKLKKIFGIDKVTFDEPGQSQEQDCLFVEIQTATNIIKAGRQIARVEGQAVMFGQNDKVKFGFFSKRIEKADDADTSSFFFFDIEENSRRYRNLVQRSFSFIYFFDGQYDPDVGSITTVEFKEET